MIGMLCSYGIMVFLVNGYESFGDIIGDGSKASIVRNTWLCILMWCTVVHAVQLVEKQAGDEKKGNRVFLPVTIYVILGSIFIALFGWLIYRYGMNSDMRMADTFIKLVSEPVHILNILIVLAMFYFLGLRLETVINGVLLAVIFIANFIKLKFHSTFFSWFDLLQLKEMFLIGKEFLSGAQWVAVVVGLLMVICLIIRFRKRIGTFLRPCCAPLKSLVWFAFFSF